MLKEFVIINKLYEKTKFISKKNSYFDIKLSSLKG